ncbi:DUF1543 domain-containing protein [Daejeonella oryzae]|uniref:DUF1543 domain-containing protein n=1 Tax=Daejeonella oryzae TaxID=1122943 RepID=UPI00047ADEE3|nr:DUF1543 domain-containing protein [Daejeonella oryzae]
MENPKLFMILIGCTPKGRNTEQHDIFFSIGNSMKELLPEIIKFWPEAAGKMHVDAWREVNQAGKFKVSVNIKENEHVETSENKLFFINLGGYKENEFDEFHYKLLLPATDKAEAIRQGKQTAFYKHVNFPGAESHIDDKFGIDVDDLHQIEEILTPELKSKYQIQLTENEGAADDEINLGYFKLSSF